MRSHCSGRCGPSLSASQVRESIKAGVTMATGTDCPGSCALVSMELVYLVELFGLSPLEAIIRDASTVASTSATNAALATAAEAHSSFAAVRGKSPPNSGTGRPVVTRKSALFRDDNNTSSLPTPLPSSCWYISMDERGYTHAPTQALNEYYAESTSDAGLGTAGFFIHARAAQHYLAKWRHNVTKPFDLLIHQSNMEDPAARGRICFMRNAGPRVVHDGRASASKRRQAEAEALEKGKAQRRGHVPEQPKAFVFG